MLYMIYGVKGIDLYDHSKSRVVINENGHPETMHDVLKEYSERYRRCVDRQEIAWINLYIMAITSKEVQIVSEFRYAKDEMQRIQINPKAKPDASKKMAAPSSDVLNLWTDIINGGNFNVPVTLTGEAVSDEDSSIEL